MTDKYDDAVGSVLQDTAANIRNNVQLSIGANPDQEAGYAHLAKFIQAPVESVRADPDLARQQAAGQAMDADKIASDYPHLAKFLTNADNTRQAHDVIPQMAATEAAAKAIPAVDDGYTSMTPDTSPVKGPTLRERLSDLWRGMFGAPTVAQSQQAQREAEATAILAGRRNTPGLTDDQAWEASRQALGGISQIPQIAAERFADSATFGLAAPVTPTKSHSWQASVSGGVAQLGGFLVGPGKVAHAMINPLEHAAGESFVKAISKDVISQGANLALASALEKSGHAVLDTTSTDEAGKIIGDALQGGAEMGGVFGAAGRLLPDSTAIQAVLRAVGVNVGLDALQGTSPGDDRPLEDKVFNYLLNTLFSLHGAGRTEGGWLHDVSLAKQAEADHTTLNTMSEAFATNPYRARNADAFHEFVQNVSEDGQHLDAVYIDAHKLGEVLDQSGVTAEQLTTALPGVAKQMKEALETRGDVKIPMADYATLIAGGPLDKALLPELKTTPGAMTYAQAQEYGARQGEELKGAAERIVGEQQKADAHAVDLKTVEDKLVSELVATGRLDESAARASVVPLREFYRTQAEVHGIAPSEMYARYPLKVLGERLVGGLDQSEGAFGPVLTEHYHDAPGAIAKLKEMKTGEALGALHHPDIGDIDLPWGVEGKNEHDGYGLAKLLRWHPEVVDNLQDIIGSMKVRTRSENRAQLESETHKGAVRLQWDGVAKKWLLTAFEKDGSGAGPRTDTAGEGKGASLSSTPDDIVDQHLNKFYQSAREKPYGFSQVETPQFKKWSHDAPLVISADALGHEFKTGDKVVVEAFHGTARPDRVGTSFKKSKATSGPMAYFTNSPELGSKYAEGKQDTSLSYEDQSYANWFKYQPKGERSPIDIVRAWHRLDAETKAKIRENAPALRLDDEGNVVSEAGNTSGNGSYDHNLEVSKRRDYMRQGNPLEALTEDWLNSGVLYGDEEKFMDVLRHAGFPTKDVNYDSPHAAYPFVYKTFIKMQKPLVTDDIPAEAMDALAAAAKRDRSRAANGGADMWDKNTRTLREWYGELTNPENTNTAYVWTSIPDKVTKVFKDLGYDGIIDVGGKGGGEKHRVYIPFEENQVKSAIGNKGTFGDTSNILKQGEGNRGSFDPTTLTIGMLKRADLSTYLHETGHAFLEMTADMAVQPNAPERITKDFGTLLDWFGVKGSPEQSAADEWHGMTLEEKREFHEQFARGFEAYLMEGKAPSLELQGVFSRFRSWLLNIYKSLKGLNVELTPEVRGVFDRMLASDAAIKEAESVRQYAPLFKSEADFAGSGVSMHDYMQMGQQATDEAVRGMQAKSMKDMAWAGRLEARALREVTKQANALRRDERIQAAKEIWSQPVYQAWQFLTGKLEGPKAAKEKYQPNPNVDHGVDSLHTAIAKLGGINRDEALKTWGLDPKDKWEAEGAKADLTKKADRELLRKNGRSIDDMAQRLADEGYIPNDTHGKADVKDLEAVFHDGADRYSTFADYDRLNEKPALNAEDLKDTTAGRLDLNAVRKLEGGDRVEKLRMAQHGGLDPDIVAEMFGYEDGQDLVRALASADHPREAIEGLTDQHMLERHGELADPQSIERAAEALIHNEVRAKFIATGLKVLTKSPTPASQINRMAKEAAEAAIAAKRVRDLSPGQYAAQEARANKDAIKQAATDPQQAAVSQRAALLNNRLFKAANEAVADVKKGLDYLKKFDKPSVREGIDLEYRDQIDALLDRFDLRKSVSGTALDKKEALAAFVERMAGMGYEPQIPEKLLNELNRQHFKDMSVEEFRGLVDGIKSIEHLGRLKNRLLDLKEMREIGALADEAAATMAQLPQRDPESNRGLSRMEAKWMGVKSIGRSGQAALLKMEQMFDWLDKRNPNGVMNRVVFRRIAEAGTRENDLLATVKGEIDKLVETNLADVTKDKGKIYSSPTLLDGMTGKPQKFTKKEMLSLAGNYGNESNLDKIAKGEQWHPDAIKAFLDTNMTKADWDFVAGMGKAIESLWPEKLAMSRRLGNTNPEKIQPRAFDTPHGRYDGWYWPMIYDPARAADVETRGEKSMFDQQFIRTNTDTGRMNTRNANYARPVLLSMDAIPRVIKDESHDIAFHEAIMDVQKFVSHPKVREGIVNALGQEHYDQILGKGGTGDSWLRSIANDGKLDNDGMRALKFFNDLARGARTRATIVGLGYRLTTMLVHGASAGLESVAELGPKWMAAGAKDFINPGQWSANKDFVFERSGEMRNRMNEVDRDVREHLRQIDLKLMDPATGAIERGKDVLLAHAYTGIAMLDMASALPTWMGAYHKAMAPKDAGGLEMGEAEAVYYADKTVRNAHGGTGVKDLAAVQRGPEFFKLFTMFYTFWNHNINRLMDTGKLIASAEHRAGVKEANNWSDRELTGMIIMRTLIYTLGVQAMHGMLHPSKDDQGETNWFKWAAKEFASAAFAGIPVFRDLAAHYIGGKDYSVTPAASMVDAVGNTGLDAVHAAMGEQVSDKWLKHAITTAGYTFGLPTGQIAGSGQFLWDVASGHQNPDSMADWWHGMLHGDMRAH